MIEITREMALLGLGGFLAALLLIFLFIAVADSRRRKHLENMIENRTEELSEKIDAWVKELTGRLDYQKAAIRELDDRAALSERRLTESESRINKILGALGNDRDGNPRDIPFDKYDQWDEKVLDLRCKLEDLSVKHEKLCETFNNYSYKTDENLDAVETAVTADIKDLRFRQDEAFEALKLLKQKIFDVEEELSGPFRSILSKNTDDIVGLNLTCDRLENQFHDRIQNFTKEITDLRLELSGTKKDLSDVTERLYVTSNTFESETRNIRQDVAELRARITGNAYDQYGTPIHIPTVSVFPSDQKWETVTTVSGLCVEPKKHRKHKKRRDAK